jgi:tetratricopeptide (TPR) repeat protein
MSDARGRFRFRRIAAGAYTLGVFLPGVGQTQRTIEVGPGVAASAGRVNIHVALDQGNITPDRSMLVSARELAIPQRARDEYEAAQKKLSKADTAAAIVYLRRAVEIAPGFADAWNNLGTIAYHAREYVSAEHYFREALRADPDAYPPLVNLGGVLLNLGKTDEAWHHNVYAILKRPADALAQSQLGMTYFTMQKFDLAEKHLLEAIRLDPAHFSHPQLLLAEVYVRRGSPARAADQLESFLRHHPDWPAAQKLKQAIEVFRRQLEK